MCVLPATCSARVRSSPSAALPSQTFPRQRPRRTPKAAALARTSDRHRRTLHRPTALCLRHRRRRQRRPRRRTAQRLFYSHSSILLFLPPFTIARSSDPSLPLSQALGPLYAPASHCQSAESTSGAGAPCTHRARLPPSSVRWLVAVTFLPGLSRRGRSRPKLTKGGGSLCLTLWIHIEPEERHRTIPIKPLCFLS